MSGSNENMAQEKRGVYVLYGDGHSAGIINQKPRYGACLIHDKKRDSRTNLLSLLVFSYN